MNDFRRESRRPSITPLEDYDALSRQLDSLLCALKAKEDLLIPGAPTGEDSITALKGKITALEDLEIEATGQTDSLDPAIQNRLRSEKQRLMALLREAIEYQETAGLEAQIRDILEKMGEIDTATSRPIAGDES